MARNDIQLNPLERVVAALAPKWGFRRLRDKTALALAGGYHGASLSRAAMRGWKPANGEADDVSLSDLPALRANARDLVRNAPLACGAINTMVTNVVGTGLSLQPAIDAAYLGLSDDQAVAWQETAKREFRLWCESPDCDTTRAQDFYGLQSLAFRSALESGDVFALTPEIPRDGPYHLTVQLIEADRVCNPNWKTDTETLRGGVELSGLGEAVAVHIANHHPQATVNRKAMVWERRPVRGAGGRLNVIHLFERRRPGQTRGIPVLAPVIEPLKQLGRYTDAELQAAVVSGAFAVFLKMDPDAFAEIFDNDGQGNYLKSATSWDGSLDRLNSLDGPGKAVNLLPGESVESVNPGRPNAEFDPFVQAIIRQVGVALEVPFEVLIKHFTASYSAARAALLDAWRFFRGRRDWMATHFCAPLYRLWMDEAVAIGRLPAPGYFADPLVRKAYQGAVWIGDGPGSIDPQREVEAARARVELGISTRSAESILHDGVDWEVKHRQLVKEEAARKSDGLRADDPAPQAAQPAQPEPPARGDEALAAAISGMSAAMAAGLSADRPAPPAPVVNITQAATPSRVMVPVRDPETGMIVAVHPVDRLMENEDGQDDED
jgi:lambda family phage portal protein